MEHPAVLISPVPMRNPQVALNLKHHSVSTERKWKYSTLLWIAKMQQFLIVIDKYTKSGKFGYPYSFSAAPDEFLLLGWGHKATKWKITGSQFFSSGKKMHITNHIQLPCEKEWSKNSYEDPSCDSCYDQASWAEGSASPSCLFAEFGSGLWQAEGT